VRLNDLQAGNSFEDALTQAVEAMCVGLPGTSISVSRENPVAADRSPEERLENTLERARDSQSAVVARAYADRVSETTAGGPAKVGQQNNAAGTRAATELFDRTRTPR
jgi:hypothetical protein